MIIEHDDMMRDFNEYVNDMKYARALPAMQEAAEQEVDRHKMERTDLFWEAMSYDAWDSEPSVVDNLVVAVYHGDAAAVGQILLDRANRYLYESVWKEIEDDWENYVDG